MQDFSNAARVTNSTNDNKPTQHMRVPHQRDNSNGLMHQNSGSFNLGCVQNMALQDPSTQKILRDLYVKHVKQMFNLHENSLEKNMEEEIEFIRERNALKLQYERNQNEHQKRIHEGEIQILQKRSEHFDEEHSYYRTKNQTEIEFIAFRNSQELEHQKQKFSMELQRIEPSRKRARTAIEYAINAVSPLSNEFEEGEHDFFEAAHSSQSIHADCQKANFKLRHVICSGSTKLIEKGGILIKAEGQDCECKIYKKTKGEKHAHYIIDVIACKKQVSRIIKAMGCKFIQSKEINCEIKLKHLLEELQTNLSQFTSKFSSN